MNFRRISSSQLIGSYSETGKASIIMECNGLELLGLTSWWPKRSYGSLAIGQILVLFYANFPLAASAQIMCEGAYNP